MPATLNGHSTPLEKLRAFLELEQTSDLQWQGRCPCHDDRTASLCVGEVSSGGTALVHCQAGCSNRDILAFGGLTTKDLFIQRTGSKGEIVRAYDYRNAKGELVLQSVRFEPKRFLQRRPKASGGWEWSVKGCEIIPYKLPEILASAEDETLFISEGEKDVETLAKWDLIATCNAGGAGKWRKQHTDQLPPRHVVILCDNDDAGRSHGEQVAKSLAGKALSIKRVDLPVKAKGDVTDFAEAGGTKEQLLTIVAAVPEWVEATAAPAPTKAKAIILPDACTDVANAQRFAEAHGGRVKYVHLWKRHLIRAVSRWQFDDSGAVMRLAKKTADSIYAEAAKLDDPDDQERIVKWAKASHSLARLTAMVELAKSEEPIPISHDQLDSDPWLLNCDNGTIDLHTGELRRHAAGDLITKTTGVEYSDESGDEPVLWLEFLHTIFRGDAELIGFVQRLLGSALVGEVVEHILPIFWGGGANGKSVLIETAMAAMGDYAMKAPAGMLMANRGQRHPTELADLYRVRLLVIAETGENQRLDERLCKELTGGDTIRARRMHENFWQFKPSHTALMVTNHQPIVRGTDNGIWRRLRLVPFTVTIPEKDQDKNLPNKLRSELGSILRWMVQGCIEWQRHTLQAPQQVLVATDAYKRESDTFAQWFDEHLKAEPSMGYMASIKASTAFASYKAWCEEIGERNLSNRRFGERMNERITGKRVSNGTYYEGVAWNHQD